MKRTFYLLVCRACGDGDLTLPFGSAEERGKWAAAHTKGTGHDVWRVWDKTRDEAEVGESFASREERGEPAQDDLEGADLVPITLVPIEVFGGDCDCHEKHGEGRRDDCTGWGYGLSDAVQGWSDCNRADGRIYRVDETDPKYREPGETVTVYVPRVSLSWFEKHWGEGAQARADQQAEQERVVRRIMGKEEAS